MRKFKFYLIGLIPGLLFVFFILNKKGASCSGYLPNSRVIAETLSKQFVFEPQFDKALKENNIDEKFLRDSLITNGFIDFNQSKAQEKPCPYYLLKYPKENTRYIISYTKCKDNARFTKFEKLK